MSSIENIVDEAANIAVLDSEGHIRSRGTGEDTLGRAALQGHAEPNGRDWKRFWNEGTDAVMDVPVGGVCEILYGT